MTHRAPLIIGLGDYGFSRIRFAEDVEKLGQRNLVAYVSTYPSSVEQWFPYPPTERRRLLDAWFKEKFEQIQAKVTLRNIKQLKRRSYNFFSCGLDAAELPKLLAIDGITLVMIREIEGLKPVKQRKRKYLEWYAVKARFVIQVEGQTDGMQSFEDRTVLVKAYDFEDAKKCAMPEFLAYGHIYLNSYGEMVTWRFESVLEIYHTSIENFDPKGTEVYSTMGKRRMRPEYEWHPLQENKAE